MLQAIEACDLRKDPFNLTTPPDQGINAACSGKKFAGRMLIGTLQSA